MPDYTPVYGDPDTVTYTAWATITGGDVLKVAAADAVAPADLNCGSFAGVAAHDAAIGQLVTVYTGSGLIHESRAAVATAATALVYAGSTSPPGELGAANTSYTMPIGVAVRSTTAIHQLLRWKSLVG